MAESEANPTTEPLSTTDGGEKHLKHLEFVQSAVIYFVVCFSTVYEYAKENSGPLKPGVQTVESTVKTVIGPVYERFQDVPFEVLKFVDLKVDDTLNELNRHVPSVMKQAPSQAKFKELASEGVKMASRMANSVYKKYEPTAKELYASYEPVAEKYAVSAWREMNKLPLFPQVAQVAVPTAAYVAEKYNVAVCYTAEKGYPVAQYLPLVPIEKIAKVFKEGENVPPVAQSGQSAQSNQVMT
ncbi:stress-related protein-like isoform X2 [Cynara cardunculus var. scolymus]|uniref:stress-related protein-like isoform X2 n=1 Tax=Cynara cardunculus var. scolymus TaxID=59895 RepID=UPI000D62F295|nr:stress-related protein-like isoform X2 [Cynara cardunculus var. scolymus]